MPAPSSALQPADISALSAFELGVMLGDVERQHAHYTDIAVKAERALGNAESDLILNPDDRQTKAIARRIRGNLNAAKLQLSALNKRQSRIQSLLKNMGPTPI